MSKRLGAVERRWMVYGYRPDRGVFAREYVAETPHKAERLFKQHYAGAKVHEIFLLEEQGAILGAAPPPPAWIVWTEDASGPSPKVVYTDREKAADAIYEDLIELVVYLAQQDPGDEEAELLEEIRDDLANGKIWEAIESWQQYDRDFDPTRVYYTLKIEEAIKGD